MFDWATTHKLGEGKEQYRGMKPMQDGVQMPVGRFRGAHVAESGSEKQIPSVVSLFLKSGALKAR